MANSVKTLYSFIQGEQREVEVTLKPITDTSAAMTFEAALVEGDNQIDQKKPPVRRRPEGVKTVLTVRVPTARGLWLNTNTYTEGEWARVADGTAYVLKSTPSGSDPTADDAWEEYTPNKVFIQFPEAMIDLWSQLPKADTPVYGFLGVRATETSGTFPQTYKPVNGLIEICFSPTHITP